MNYSVLPWEGLQVPIPAGLQSSIPALGSVQVGKGEELSVFSNKLISSPSSLPVILQRGAAPSRFEVGIFTLKLLSLWTRSHALAGRGARGSGAPGFTHSY